MAFENLVFILKNYVRNGYTNVLVTDLREGRIEQVSAIFNDHSYAIVTLVVNDEVELRRRVVDPERDSGFRDIDAAVAWNKRERERDLFVNEHRIDNTGTDATTTTRAVLNVSLTTNV